MWAYWRLKLRSPQPGGLRGVGVSHHRHPGKVALLADGGDSRCGPSGQPAQKTWPCSMCPSQEEVVPVNTNAVLQPQPTCTADSRTAPGTYCGGYQCLTQEPASKREMEQVRASPI